MAATPSSRRHAREARSAARRRIIDAARDLLRTRTFAQLTVDQVMREAGGTRTVFYRHFDDLADLLTEASRDAIGELYRIQESLVLRPAADTSGAIRAVFRSAVEIYREQGPLLRGVAEAARAHPDLAAGHRALRERFDGLALAALRSGSASRGLAFSNLEETAHALNGMNETYLTDAFGREPRVSAETAVETLSQIWEAVLAYPARS